MLIKYIKVDVLASFPGLPQLQFLIACSTQKYCKNQGRPGNKAKMSCILSQQNFLFRIGNFDQYLECTHTHTHTHVNTLRFLLGSFFAAFRIDIMHPIVACLSFYHPFHLAKRSVIELKSDYNSSLKHLLELFQAANQSYSTSPGLTEAQ